MEAYLQTVVRSTPGRFEIGVPYAVYIVRAFLGYMERVHIRRAHVIAHSVLACLPPSLVFDLYIWLPLQQRNPHDRRRLGRPLLILKHGPVTRDQTQPALSPRLRLDTSLDI